ncbi:hypothetical protein ACG7TL_005769 [Trametes sanguinea]
MQTTSDARRKRRWLNTVTSGLQPSGIPSSLALTKSLPGRAEHAAALSGSNASPHSKPTSVRPERVPFRAAEVRDCAQNPQNPQGGPRAI